MNVIELGEETYRRVGDYPRALIFEGREYSSGELRDMSLKLAGALVDLGVRPGDRVAVMMPNAPEVGVIYSACWRIGAVVVPILFLLAATEVEHILVDSAPKAIITTTDFLPVLMRGAVRLDPPPAMIVTGDSPAPETLALDRLLRDANPREEITDCQPTDLSGILYTSGTTGRPKGVMLTHGGMSAVSNSFMETGDYEDGQIALGSLPLAHGYGILTQLVGMRLKGTGVLMRWFDPTEALRLIDEHRIQLFSAVPTMLVYLINHPELDKYDGTSLERVGVGAAPCPLEVIEAFEKRFQCDVFEGYGLTESTIACCTQRRTRPKVVGSVGIPLPGMEVKILDDDHNEMPRGELGEICIRGGTVTPGYYHNQLATDEAIQDGWLHTGDVGKQDADGNFYVVERKKDMIIRGGLNVYPRDIEEVLFEHPQVAQAAVIGRPDPSYGEEVVAFVVPKSGTSPTEAEIIDFVRARLAKYKTPKEVHFLDDLPKNQVGKILRRQLREQLVAASS